MNLLKKNIIFFYLIFLCSCAQHGQIKKTELKEKKYYSSSGFALIYDEKLISQKIVNKKIDNNKIQTLHYILKKNTPVRITNLQNSKFLETKISKKGEYPKIFNIVISDKIAEILDLDPENPYIEISEIKKNKKFIAKISNTFDEERNVAEKAPVQTVEMDDLNSTL